MTTVSRLLSVASAAALVAALAPAPAHAAVPSDPNAVLVAGPAPQIFQGEPNKRIWETMEVRNDSDKPLRVVLHVKTEGLWFAGAYHTCRYTDNLPSDRIPAGGEEAVCEPPNAIEPGGSYKLGGEMIRVHPKAVPGAVHSYTFTWYTKEFADAQGPAFLGRDKMTPGFKGLPLMTKVTPETPYSGSNTSSGTVVVIPPAPTPTPTVTPTTPPGGGEEEPSSPAPTATTSVPVTPTATATATATPSAPATTEAPGGVGGGDTGGDTGGDLALTGTNVAVIGGLGALLLAGGAVAFFLARRRRTAFTA